MDTNLPDRVRQFVCDFGYQSPHRLRSDARLEEDLDMTGDDAAEFLEAFAEVFEVDLTGIEFHRYFCPECGGPILLWPRALKEELEDLGEYPVTVGHLVEVATAKRWPCPPPHGRRKWPDLPRDFGGMKFEGRGQFGYDPNKKKYIGTWIDSMNPTLSILEGEYDPKTKTMTFVGEGTGPDGKTKYTQKMVTKTNDDGTKVFTLYMKFDGGKDDVKFMEITYQKRK